LPSQAESAEPVALAGNDEQMFGEEQQIRHVFDVRFGSKAADMIGAMQRPMSALPPKADK
jgi:hypothetical protein